MTTHILLVVGSVSASEYDPIRHSLVRMGLHIRVVRIMQTALDEIDDDAQNEIAMNTPYYGDSRDLDQGFEAKLEQNLLKYASRAIDASAEAVIGILWSKAAYEYCGDESRHNDSLTDNLRFFPNKKATYIIHPEWVETKH